jgi:hypothetical protein
MPRGAAVPPLPPSRRGSGWPANRAALPLRRTPPTGTSAAGSRASGAGFRIGNPARRRALVPSGQKRAGVSRELVSRAWA